jgi:hypothetical protein
MITCVVKDILWFLVVFLIAIAAFADAYLAISRGNMVEEDQFLTGPVDGLIYIYKMCLGDFDLDGMGQVARPLAIVLFLLCTIFNLIVMFNLLIAIISDTFRIVNENSVQAGYQEKACIISENYYLVPLSVRKEHSPKDSFLVYVKHRKNEEIEKNGKVENKVDGKLIKS